MDGTESLKPNKQQITTNNKTNNATDETGERVGDILPIYYQESVGTDNWNIRHNPISGVSLKK